MTDLLLKDLCLKHLDMFKAAISEENNSQLLKWGVQSRTPAEWLMFLGEEFGELCKAVAKHQFRNGDKWDVYDEAIQVITLSLKIAEMYYFLTEKSIEEKPKEKTDG